MLNTNQPLISVLMPAYNCDGYVHQAIESILNQDYENWELLVADDGSNDKTRLIIDGFDDVRIRKFHNEKNIGYLKTSNKLFGLAQGTYITFQDADDYSLSSRFSTLLKKFIEDVDLVAVGSFVKRINEKNDEIAEIIFKCEWEEIKNDLPNFFNCVGSALMVRKDFSGILFNEYFDRIGSEDLYWYGKIALKNKVINVPQVLYIYRMHPHSVSSSSKGDIRKESSREFATYSLEYFKRYNREIFSDPNALRSLEQFLKGKYMIWDNEIKAGFRNVIASIFSSRFFFKNKLEIIRVYLPQYFRS